MKDRKGKLVNENDIVVIHSADFIGHLGVIKRCYDDIKPNGGCSLDVDRYKDLWFDSVEIESLGVAL